jgi:uncharacterized protein YecE (DUF72 family)
LGAACRDGLRPAHIGCSGWNYRDWRRTVYPPGLPTRDWLGCYAERFDTVEVNATFYRLLNREAVERWVEQTPSGFRFAVKASRFLTHVKRLDDIAEGVARFFERIEPLVESHRLGPVVWQLPDSFSRDDLRLHAALSELPPALHAIEFRHPSWFAPDVYELLRRHRCALVLGDHPRRPFQTREATARWRYLRLHFGRHGRRGNYSESELERWARRLHRWRGERELFVYFNNDWEAFAPANAEWLRRRLAELAGERDG